jgi:hypothetical protein
MRRFSISLLDGPQERRVSRLAYSGRAIAQTPVEVMLPRVAGCGGQPWQCRLIYLAIAAQLVNMLMAMYMTSFLRFGDVLLDIFGTWDLALMAKCLAFGFWILQRDRPAARFAAWIIAPLSVLALFHDLLLLASP